MICNQKTRLLLINTKAMTALPKNCLLTYLSFISTYILIYLLMQSTEAFKPLLLCSTLLCPVMLAIKFTGTDEMCFQRSTAFARTHLVQKQFFYLLY